MRGDERVQDSMFSYLTLEQRVPSDHPLREIRALTDGVLQSLDAEFAKLYAATGRASNRAGVYAAGASVAGVLLDPLGAPVGRAARLQPAVPLVRRPGHGRRGLEPCCLLQERLPAAQLRGGTTVFCRREPAGEAIHE